MRFITPIGTTGAGVPDDDSVSSVKLQANAVTLAKMADDSVGIAELSATGTASTGTFLRGDNSWTALPCDFILVQTGNTARAVGSGDFAAGHYVGRAFTVTKVIYQFDTADASGNTTVELRRNGSQVTSSNITVLAASQVDGTATDAARTVTISQSFAVGDRINLQVTATGTTPGKGLRAWILGTWN